MFSYDSLKESPLLQITGKEMRNVMNLNVMALVRCAKLAVKSMMDRGINDGHIFNVSSMLGHSVLGIKNFYSASKSAVNAITQGLRKELGEKGSRIRVTLLSPGRTMSNFHQNTMEDKVKLKAYLENTEMLKPQDVTDALIYALSAPEYVQVYDVQIHPTHLGNLSIYNTNRK